MKRVITAVATTCLATLGIVWLALVVVARTGAVDVAATADYVPGAEWFFSTLSRESIRRQAGAAVAAGELLPRSEVDASTMRTGAQHYQEMCVVCHGAPGARRGELGQGMKPQPPDLSHTAREWSEAEILWTLENGIRHTGMPAFGETHSTDELQAIAAFVGRLDGMSPEEYRRLAGAPAGESAGSSDAAASDHDHGHSGDRH